MLTLLSQVLRKTVTVHSWTQEGRLPTLALQGTNGRGTTDGQKGHMHYASPTGCKLELGVFSVSPPAERVAVSEGAGNEKPASFLQGPDYVFVSILLKKKKI